MDTARRRKPAARSTMLKRKSRPIQSRRRVVRLECPECQKQYVRGRCPGCGRRLEP